MYRVPMDTDFLFGQRHQILVDAFQDEIHICPCHGDAAGQGFFVGLVALQHHDGVAARRRAVELHRGDVDAVLAQTGGDGCHMAGRVLVVDDQRVVVSAKIRRDAVDLADVDPPAADGRADDLELTARRTGQPQHRRVGVRAAQVCGADLKVQPGLLGNGKAVRDAVIVRLHAQQPGDKRPVRAVAAPRGGKAAVKQDLGLGRLLPQESPRRAADAHRTRRVAAGRPRHDRAEHIK